MTFEELKNVIVETLNADADGIDAVYFFHITKNMKSLKIVLAAVKIGRAHV